MTTPHWIDQADVTWIRALARTLAKDEGRADDAAQETLLVWMKRLPGRSAPRGWLRRVLENRLRQGVREDTRRARREREQLVPDTGEAGAVQRARLQRQVMDRVLALDEPYRETILQRYFEGLGPSKIAARQGVPVETVKTRLKRGLARLRTSLDGEFDGERGAWVMAFGTHLISHVPPAAGALATAAGASIMTNKLFIVPAALVAIATLYVSLRPSDDDLLRSAEGATRTEANLELATGDEPGGAVPASGPGRALETTAASDDPAPEPTATASPAAAMTINARVIDQSGSAVTGVPILRVDPEKGSEAAQGVEVGTSDGGGRLELIVDRGAASLIVETDRWTTIQPGTVQAIGSHTEATILVAAPRLIEGRVIDHLGEPVSGAEVRYTTKVNPWTSLEITVDYASAPRFRAHTDEAGAFRFARTPELEDPFLEVIVNGDQCTEVSIAASGNVWQEVKLIDPAEREGWLRGTVVDRAGDPVEGAQVSLGYICVSTGGDGSFALDMALPTTENGLVAAAPGHLPGRVLAAEDGTWPNPLVVVLGDAPLTLTGKVLRANGEPFEGARLRLLGTAEFGHARDEADASSLTRLSVESYLGGKHGPKAKTPASGAFEFRGLRPTDYRILVNVEGQLEGWVHGPVAAGSLGVVITMPDEPEEVLITGRVTDSSGAPIAAASVSIHGSIPDPGDGAAPANLRGPSTRTADDGHFAFEPLGVSAGAAVRIHVFAGAGYAFVHEPIDITDDHAELEIVVPALAPFFVESGETGAGFFELRGADGEPAGLFQAEGHGMFSMKSGFFSEGRSPVFSAAEGSYEIVLLGANDEIVGRREVELEPGEPLRVAF